MNVYPITFTNTLGQVINAELVTDVTLQTDYWTLVPNANGTEYSGYPSGVLPFITWSNIPDFLNVATPTSVNILTTYVTTNTTVTLALNGTLSAGWAFSPITNLLTYDGVSGGAPLPISFTATAPGLTANSNTFSISGQPPIVPVWSTVPNILNQRASYSVNVLTTYITPPTGCTCVVVGSLPTGWTFDGTTLSYNGSSVAGPSTVYFTATYVANGQTANSNSFQLQGIGPAASDTFAPPVPTGLTAINIAQTTATLTAFPSSDPAPAAVNWTGMGSYTLTAAGVGGSPFTVASAVGNEPLLTFTDIGTVTTPTTYSQSGADVTFTNVYANSSFALVDSMATAMQQLTLGTYPVTVSCRIDAFAAGGYNYAKVGVGFRNSLASNAAYIRLNSTPISGGIGFNLESRSAPGVQPTSLYAYSATTVAPRYLIIQAISATQVKAWVSFSGNLDAASIFLGTFPFAFTSPFYAGASTNTDPAQATPYTVVVKQLNIQTTAAVTQNLTGLTANTAYTATIAATDNASNASASSNSYTFTTASSGGGFPSSRSKTVWPWANYSFWNLPRGANMQLSSQSVMTLLAGANSVVNGAPKGYFIEFEFNLTAPIQNTPFKVTGRQIYTQTSPLNWGLSNNLCSVTGTPIYNSTPGDALVTHQTPALYPIPDAYVPNLTSWGSQGPQAGQYKANFCCAILLPDGTTVAQNQQFARCAAASNAASGSCYDTPELKKNTGYNNGGNYASSNDIHTGDGRFGPHGASRTSVLGGSIRKYDLDQGVIRHALKIIVPITWLNGTGNYAGEKIGYSTTSGFGYVWPAYSRDDNGQTYSGPSTYVRMGSHLVLNPSLNIGTSPTTGLGFETTLGRMMGQAAQTYGIYIVDSIGGNSPILWLVNVETDPSTGAAVPLDTYVKAMYGGLSMYQYNNYGRGTPGDGNLVYMWNRDMDRIWKNLYVDLSCAPPTIPLTGQGMGGGTAVAPYAPAFSD